jgi:DDE superfamily endonuclease
MAAAMQRHDSDLRWIDESHAGTFVRQTGDGAITLHYTPTYSSWLNQVERWFSELTTKKLRRCTHRSVAELRRDITDWVRQTSCDVAARSIRSGCFRREPLAPSIGRTGTTASRRDSSTLTACVQFGHHQLDWHGTTGSDYG